MTEGNIMAVYGVKAQVYKMALGKLHIVPIEPAAFKEGIRETLPSLSS
ncbi:hypothetical protein H5T51_04420 [Candidatus Bathyarchaeota archaeon]|nr:hypothetical protein [Candidatus Bathyarchaeota archaeon]